MKNKINIRLAGIAILAIVATMFGITFIYYGLFEKQVLDLHITGMGYAQIAKVLGKDEKSTDNALQRTKAKIKKMIIS